MFKKGEKVSYISDWDRKGTVVTREAIVYSCGKKQMILTCAISGKEIGRNFKPQVAEAGETGTYKLLEGDALQAAAMLVAEKVLEKERAHFARCLAIGAGANYDDGIRKQLAQLHDAEVLTRAEADQRISRR